MHICIEASYLKVKAAFDPHTLQIADKFFTFSAKGIKPAIEGQDYFRKSLFNAEIITIFPRLAARSLNSTKSSKNWPSSTPSTSWSIHSFSSMLSKF